MTKYGLNLLLILMLCAGVLCAVPVTMTFEGLQNQEAINDFYNGGTGSLGSGPGPNYGVHFTSDSLALIDGAHGGSGNFTNEPSCCTIAFFLSGAGDTMDVASGFDTGFSFFYTSTSFAGDVTVWSGLNGTGTLLTTINLAALGGCSTAPNFCNWAAAGGSFAGVAESAIFTGVANQIGFDNITIGSSSPGTVPEPRLIILPLMLLFGIVYSFRKKLGFSV